MLTCDHILCGTLRESLLMLPFKSGLFCQVETDDRSPAPVQSPPNCKVIFIRRINKRGSLLNRYQAIIQKRIIKTHSVHHIRIASADFDIVIKMKKLMIGDSR